MVAKSQSKKSRVQFWNDRHPGVSLSMPNSKMLSTVEAEAKSGAVPSQRFSGPERKSSS
jgi:hypothetical protein